jgi:hypothetical protein
MAQNLRIEYLHRINELSYFADSWNSIYKNNNEDRFYLSYDWFFCLLNYSKETQIKPSLFIIKDDNNNIIAIIPCILNSKKKRLFNLKTLQLAGNVYAFERGAIVNSDAIDEIADLFSDYLLGDFSNSWDILEFTNISPSDRFHSLFIEKLKNKGIFNLHKPQFQSIVSDFSHFQNFNEFNKTLSKNFRRKITKSINKMNRDGEFTIHLLESNANSIEKSIDDYYHVYSKSWKTKEVDSSFHRKMAEYLHNKNKLRLLILYFNPSSDDNSKSLDNPIKSSQDMISPSNKANDTGIPIAAYYAVQEGKTTFGLKTVYDTDYSNYSAGSVIIYFFAKYLIDIEKSNALNHQIGTEDFKYHIGGKDKATYITTHAANTRSLAAKLELYIDKYAPPALKRALQNIKRAGSK